MPRERVTRVRWLSSNRNIAERSPRAAAVHHEVRRQRRLAGAGRADQQRAGAAIQAAAEQRVQSPAGRWLTGVLRPSRR